MPLNFINHRVSYNRNRRCILNKKKIRLWLERNDSKDFKRILVDSFRNQSVKKQVQRCKMIGEKGIAKRKKRLVSNDSSDLGIYSISLTMEKRKG